MKMHVMERKQNGEGGFPKFSLKRIDTIVTTSPYHHQDIICKRGTEKQHTVKQHTATAIPIHSISIHYIIFLFVGNIYNYIFVDNPFSPPGYI